MNSLLVITEYPNPGEIHGRSSVGGATYTKIILSSIKKLFPNTEITVAAAGSGKTRIDEGIVIKRVWKRNSLLSLFSLFFFALFSKTNHIVTSFEGYMFGKEYHAALVLCLLLVLRLFGKQTTMILHQVPKDFSSIEKQKLKAFVMQLAKRFVYNLILLGNDHVIVFEEAFRKQLTKTPNGKVSFIPLPTPVSKPISKQKARKLLGLEKNSFYTLYFGFFAPYKGVDWLVENWDEGKMNSKLLLAGGISPHYVNDSRVVTFVNGVEQKARKKGIFAPGFIAEKDLPLYFSAADVLLMPYKTFMSSSGPMALAFSYNLPVLFSEQLRGYTESNDVSASLETSLLTAESILFTHTQDSLKKAIRTAQKDYAKLANFAKAMKARRSEEQIAQNFYQTLTTPRKAFSLTPSPAFIKAESK